MNEPIIDAVFRPKPSRHETKADATTRAAREIIDHETSAREAKTARLRAARLAVQATEKPASPVRKPRRKR